MPLSGNPIDAFELLKSHKVDMGGMFEGVKEPWDDALLRKANILNAVDSLENTNYATTINLAIIWTRFEVLKKIWFGEITQVEEIPNPDSEVIRTIIAEKARMVITQKDSLASALGEAGDIDLSQDKIEGEFILYPSDVEIIHDAVKRRMDCGDNLYQVEGVGENVFLQFLIHTLKNLEFPDSLLEQLEEFRQLACKGYQTEETSYLNAQKEKLAQILLLPEAEIFMQVFRWFSEYIYQIYELNHATGFRLDTDNMSHSNALGSVYPSEHVSDSIKRTGYYQHPINNITSACTIALERAREINPSRVPAKP